MKRTIGIVMVLLFGVLAAGMQDADRANAHRQQAAPEAGASPTVNVQINGSSTYGNGSKVPLKTAVLMLDTISFDGKSGFVRLQKGQTTMYVVLSNLEVGCEMKDVYDKKGFLQGNLARLVPNVPAPERDQDFVAMFVYQQHYDPKKVSGPPLADLIGGTWHITDFYHVIPGGWTPKPKDVEQLAAFAPNVIHFTDVLFGLRHVSAGEKGYKLTGKSNAGSWAYILSGESKELYLDPTRHDAPFDRSMLDLIRDGEGWALKFDLTGPTFKLSGRVPLRVCQPNFIAVS